MHFGLVLYFIFTEQTKIRFEKMKFCNSVFEIIQLDIFNVDISNVVRILILKKLIESFYGI